MRRTQYVLFLLVVLFTNNLFAETYSNRTFLTTRPNNVNSAMEYALWHPHAYKKQKPTIRTHLQVTGFYQKSQQEKNLGEYFGVGNGKNSFIVGEQADVVAGRADIENGLIIHDSQNIAANRNLAGTIALNPSHEAYGARFDFFQDITHPFDKIFFKASTTAIHVARDMGLKVTEGVSAAPLLANKTFSLVDYFKGDVAVTTVNDRQNPLKYAKIDGKRSATGLADIDLSLGYKYMYSKKKHVFLSLDVTVPTGNKVRGEYLFEPIYGNARHPGLGASVDAGINLWSDNKSTFKALGALRYKYLFEGTEHRALSVKEHKLSHYYMLGQDGKTGVALEPAANILTLPISVKPGHMIDALIDFSFMCSGFTIDVGYNFFWKDQESVWIKGFKDNVYGVVNPDYDTNTGFNVAVGGPPPVVPAAQQPFTGSLLTINDLNKEAITTPTLLTHKVFAGIGYTTKIYKKKYPLSGGIGGSYEFATSNADLENYTLWAKVLISF